MTAPHDGRTPLGRLLLSPRVVFPTLVAAVLASALLVPEGDRAGDPRLSSHSPAPMGARGLYAMSRALGWAPIRRTAPMQGRLDSAAVYLVLDNPVEMGARETSVLLDAVRRGAGLLWVVRDDEAMSDSLRIGRSRGGLPQDTLRRLAGSCARAENRTHGIGWPDGRVHSWWLRPRAPYPSDTTVFLRVRRDPPRPMRPRRTTADSALKRAIDSAAAAEAAERDDEDDPEDRVTAAAAAVGFQLGRGRVVALADPDWLRNDVLRVCRWDAAPAAARMLAWLSAPRDAVPGGTRRVVFDEYHQGHGEWAGAAGTLRELFTGTRWGRALLQATIAALVLLVALAPRPLPPAHRDRVERRSALEHVGALARAYEQVGATRLATRRLVRGARRRRAGALAGRGWSDEEWLRDVAARVPDAQGDVRRVLGALERPVSATELLAVGRSIDTIERALSR